MSHLEEQLLLLKLHVSYLLETLRKTKFKRSQIIANYHKARQEMELEPAENTKYGSFIYFLFIFHSGKP